MLVWLGRSGRPCQDWEEIPLLREKVHADVLGKDCVTKGGPIHLDFAGPLPLNRFLAPFHNGKLMRCHYLLSRQQGVQAEGMSWSAAVSAASRRKDKGNWRREEGGGAASLSEGLAKAAGRDSRKGRARAAEAMAPRPWGTHWKETDQTALE